MEANDAAKYSRSKKISIAANIVLLIWFFLDMVGVYFDTGYLVTRSWKEDGIFFGIFLAVFLFYLFKERAGSYALSVWLALWLFTQFLSHEWYTITGEGQAKMEYFQDALKWATSETRYIPDVYHTILHLLIIAALWTTLAHLVRLRKERKSAQG